MKPLISILTVLVAIALVAGGVYSLMPAPRKDTQAARGCVERFVRATENHDHLAKYNMYSKRLTSAWSLDEYLRYQRRLDAENPGIPDFRGIGSVTLIAHGEVLVKVRMRGDGQTIDQDCLVVLEDGEWKIANSIGFLPSWAAALNKDQSEMVKTAEQYLRAWVADNALIGSAVSCTRDRKDVTTAQMATLWDRLHERVTKLIYVSVPELKPAEPYMPGADGQVIAVVVSRIKSSGKLLLTRLYKVPMCNVDGKWKVLLAIGTPGDK